MENKTRDTSDAQQQEAFRRHLDRASDIVNGWPEWKKAVVGQVANESPPVEQPKPTPANGEAEHTTSVECSGQSNDHPQSDDQKS